MKLIAFLFLLLGVCRPSVTSEESAYTYNTRFRGAIYGCKVTLAVVRQTPAWSKRQPHPPLSPREAAKIATEYATHALLKNVTIPAGDNWEIVAVSLRPITQEYWLYAVDLTPPRAALLSQGIFEGRPELVRIVVLMDGEVVPLVPLSPAKRIIPDDENKSSK